jgi:TRAP-type C4-dicarboxylate transport system substrate-binding protein
LAEIDEAFTVFEIPMFYRSYDELFAVLADLTPMLRDRLDKKGYVLVNWGHAGWVHLFTKKPVRVPEDLRDQKLFVWAGDNRMVQWWKKNGYRPVPLAATDIMTGLQTGMIEALPTTPLAALSLQWYRLTPYMLDLGLAPLVGGTIVTKKAWNRLSSEDQKALLDASLEVEKRLRKAIPDQDRRAIEAMKERGMKVTDHGGEEGWRIWESAAAEFESTMRGLIVPKEYFDQAVKAREAYRQAERGGAKH